MCLWTGKQVIGMLLHPNKASPVLMNLRAKGKQYTRDEDLCFNDSCKESNRATKQVVTHYQNKVSCFNRLYVIDAYVHHTTFRLWCHFLQCSWDFGSVPAERVWTGGGGCVSTLGPVNMAASGLSCRKTLVSSGGPFLSSFA